MNDTISILSILYERLSNELALKKKIQKKQKSLIESLINIKSNERYRLLDKISIDGISYEEHFIFDLVYSGYIRMTNNFHQYTITAKGLIQYEKITFQLSAEDIIEILDSKFFNDFEKTFSLGERDILILFFMITIRAFSEKSYLHLKKNETLLNEYKKLLESCHGLLKEYGFIKPGKHSVFGKPGNEHPVSNLIRHSEQLQKKTKGIYSTLGSNQRYYLNLYNEEEKNWKSFESNLEYIFKLIFSKEISFEQYEKILSFMKKNYDKFSLLVYDDLDMHIFSHPKFTELIEKIMFKIKV
jgi:hypothetical protein